MALSLLQGAPPVVGSVPNAIGRYVVLVLVYLMSILKNQKNGLFALIVELN